MLPLWREEVFLQISPHRLVLARVKHGRPMTVLTDRGISVVCDEAQSFEPAVKVLDGALTGAPWQNAKTRVIVADHWAHYAIVPWSYELASDAERMSYARLCMTRVFGEQVNQWRISLSEGRPGHAQVACALPTALLDGITAMTAARGLRLHSVQPNLVASFNAWRKRLANAHGWFVSLDQGCLAAAHIGDGGWDYVRAIRVGRDWQTELNRLRTFARLTRKSAVAATVYLSGRRPLDGQRTADNTDLVWLDDDVAPETTEANSATSSTTVASTAASQKRDKGMPGSSGRQDTPEVDLAAFGERAAKERASLIRRMYA